MTNPVVLPKLGTLAYFKSLQTLNYIIVVVLFLLISGTSLRSQEIPSGMVLIPAGQFKMGKNTPNPTDWQPEHIVNLDRFFMDKFEVTNKEYHEFCIKTNHPLPELWGMDQFKCGLNFPDHPVVGVSFAAANRDQWL